MDISFKDQLVKWRHHLHMFPETAFDEHHTSDFLAHALKELGLEVQRDIGGTGIVASLRVGDGEGKIGLRSDMDAIVLTENGDMPYTSKNLGKMHACGHDGHMVMLLGAAKLLSERKNFSGTVRFIFQPAEEPGRGALAMLGDKILERFPLDEIYGMHNMPQYPLGTILTKTGGVMASEDNFEIHIKGKGVHASAPHLGVDPLVIAAEIISTLQTINSRSVNPTDTCVVSCTEIFTDGSHNAIPTNVLIKGDTRSFTPAVQKLIEARMKKICMSICEMHGAECEFQYTHEFSPTINTDECTEIAVMAAQNTVGEDNVNMNCDPLMSSEDFGKFLEKIPGNLVFIGTGKCDDCEIIPLHNSMYDFNDEALTIGSEYWAELVRIRLPNVIDED